MYYLDLNPTKSEFLTVLLLDTKKVPIVDSSLENTSIV